MNCEKHQRHGLEGEDRPFFDGAIGEGEEEEGETKSGEDEAV
jgi:hypothetical protein